jgi:hypothetical protein
MTTTIKKTLWSGTQFVLEVFKSQREDALRLGWICEGQLEECPDTGRKHYQFAVKTPQVRMSQVIKVFKGAHIEPARNKDALLQYVKKEETRVGDMPEVDVNKFPTADKFLNLVCQELLDTNAVPKSFRMIIGEGEWYNGRVHDDDKLGALDYATSQLIRKGIVCELHAVNPQIRSAWKKFSTDICFRFIEDRQTARQTISFSDIDIINNNARGKKDNEKSECSGREEEFEEEEDDSYYSDDGCQTIDNDSDAISCTSDSSE